MSNNAASDKEAASAVLGTCDLNSKPHCFDSCELVCKNFQPVAAPEKREDGWISVEQLPPIDPDLAKNPNGAQESKLVLAWGDCSTFGDDAYLAFYSYDEGVWFEHHDTPLAVQGIRLWKPIIPPTGTAYGLYPSQVSPEASK